MGSIPDKILIAMAQECDGDKKQIHARIKDYINNHTQVFFNIRWRAEHSLCKNYGTREQMKENRDSALRDVQAILKHSRMLKQIFCEMPDIVETPAIYLSGLALYLQGYLYHVDDQKAEENKIEHHGCGESDKKISEWDSFLELLDQHITVFENIESYLKKTRKRGRPKTINALTSFIFLIAKMYTNATGRKFTVCEYGDTENFTEGMRFAYKSLDILNKPAFPQSHRDSVPKRSFCGAVLRGRSV